MKNRLWIIFISVSLSLYANTLTQQAENAYIKGKYSQAKNLFEKAAKQGDITAQYNLGYLYEQGQGVDKNLQKAFKWYEKAAKQGYVDAQYNVATFYYTGRGVQKNLQKALYWYEQAAHYGDRNALYNLGVIYAKGTEVEKNKIKAFRFWVEAAKRSHVQAQDSLDILCKESPWACSIDSKR